MSFPNNLNSLAVVTSQGIIYRDKKYTCPLAISEQWFSLNSPYLLVKIPVIHKDDQSIIYIILDNGDLIEAQHLPNSRILPQTELEDYYYRLNQLKSEKNQRKHLHQNRRK